MYTWSFRVILIICSFYAEAYQRNWNLNWNLNSAQNWADASVLRCSKEVIFPSRPQFEWAYNSEMFEVSSMLLPFTGGILLAEGSSIVFGEQSSPDCTNSAPVQWVHVNKDRWWDPLAWKIPSELIRNQSSVPDVHKVPCKGDVVVLPDPQQLLAPIHFEPPTVTVAAVEISGKNYTTSELLDYSVVNATGVFTGYSSVSDGALLYAETNLNCQSGRVADCLCHSPKDADRIQQVVCRSRSKNCDPPFCSVPINMTGFCCPICGAELALPSSYRGTVELLTNILFSDPDSLSGASVYVGYMADNRYHVYVTPLLPDNSWQESLSRIEGLLKQELLRSGATSESLTEVQIVTSGPSTTRGSFTVAIVIVLLLLAGVAIACYTHRRVGLPSLPQLPGFNGISSEGSFPHFRRMSMVAFRRLSRVSLQSEVLTPKRSTDLTDRTSSGVADVVPTYSSETGGLRFVNPVFSKSTASLAAMPIGEDEDELSPPQQSSLEEESHGTVENPMYRAYMHMTPDEQKATDFTVFHPEAGLSEDEPPEKPKRLTVLSGAIRFSQLCTIEENNLSDVQGNKGFCEAGQMQTKEQSSVENTQLDRESLLEESPQGYTEGIGGDELGSSCNIVQEAGETKIIIEIHQTAEGKNEADE